MILAFGLRFRGAFQPHNEDGEVAEFRRVPIAEIIEVLHGKSITLDAGLVAMSFIARNGLIRLPASADGVIIGNPG